MQRQPTSDVTQQDRRVVFKSAPPSPTPGQLDDEEQIEALVEQFFGLFDNRAGVVPSLPTLPHHCLTTTTITKVSDLGVENMSVRAFMEPRARLLSEGRLREFSESEIEGHTQIFGGIAQRWLRYRKKGLLDGNSYRGEGTKSLHFVHTPAGWRIGAILWQDSAEEYPAKA